MIRTEFIDPYFKNQPPLKFIDELKTPVHTEKPYRFGQKGPSANEVDITGCYLDIDFGDNEGLLETAYADFRLFTKICGVAGDCYPIRIVRIPTQCHEAYTIEVKEDSCTVGAADTEGIRRAIIYLEDEMKIREGPYLALGCISRFPHIRSRITRCFFSPINRPPKYGDELSDDIDYYPEEYLNRLAHDGANGVWIYTRFSDLFSSSFIEEYGKDSEKRIAKLNRVIRKCKKYGIKVYLFAVEPIGLDQAMAQKYPQFKGATIANTSCFCTNSPQGEAFCREATEKLFALAPELAGFISITYGERFTSCSSAVPHFKLDCPRCKDRKPGEILSHTVNALRDGMRKQKPEAEFVSWTYGHRVWTFEDIIDYVQSAPDDVMLMQNFDDMVYEGQLGRMRVGVDYWLSATGPSDLFIVTAKLAKELGKHMFAKMQVCCSHEVATIPYVPVPGILFDKYKAAHAYGVEGVMQCWYFGNYPSMMSKAAGELAFEHGFESKDRFLERLAAIYWGNSRAKEVVRAWNFFEKGYAQYPLNIMFSYYGPVHDGPVWELQLKPKNFSLARTWQTIDKPDGDRMCDALRNGHTLQEALILVNRMSEEWKKGIDVLRQLPLEDSSAKEQMSVIRALDILYQSAGNILRFYDLRDLLGQRRGEPGAILEQMRKLVGAEMENSSALAALCVQDGRLGYHSEGEGYKFFPEKLNDRIEKLKRLLQTEFVEVKDRLKRGLSPLEYYDGVEEGIPRYELIKGSVDDAPWCSLSDRKSDFRVSYDEENLYIELHSETKPDSFILTGEFELFSPMASPIIRSDGSVQLVPDDRDKLVEDMIRRQISRWKVEVLECEGTYLRVTLKRNEIGLEKMRPFKLKVKRSNGALWVVDENPVIHLGKAELSPGQFGWVIPK